MRKKLILTFVFLFFIFGLTSCDFFGGGNDTTEPITQSTTQTQVTTEVTTEITTEDELTVQLKYIYNLAVNEGDFDGTYVEWLETVRGPQGLPGEAGREIELQAVSGILEWRYVGETTWTDLFDLNTLEGEDGQEVTFQVSDNILQWRYEDETSWTTLLDFSSFVPDIEAVKDIVINEFDEIVITYLDDTTKVMGRLTESFFVVFGGFFGVVDIQRLEYGESAYEPMLFPIPGYTFTGWDKDFTNVTEDLMVYSTYVINEYSITFEENGGEEVDDLKEVIFGTLVTLPEPEKAGAIFVGWFYGDSPNDGQFTNQTPVTSDLTLYARYIDDYLTFTVSFYAKDGSLITEVDVIAGGSATAPIPQEVEGYVFTGWSTEFNMVTSDLQVHAMYEADMGDYYNISYELNGGTNDEFNPTKYYPNTGEIGLSIPTFDEYTFLGWYDNSEFSGEPILSIDTNDLTGDLNLFAKWDMDMTSAVISFETNGGEYIAPVAVPLNETVTINTTANKDGFIFAGWYLDPLLTVPVMDDIMVIESFTVYAAWTPVGSNGYTVYYHLVDQNIEQINDILLPGEVVESHYTGFFRQMVVTNMRILAWGVNDYGQSGTGEHSPSIIEPETVIYLSDLNPGEAILDIALAPTHTIVLTTDHRVFTCGDATYGQLANGEINLVLSPVEVTGLIGLEDGEYVIDVDGGFETSYFLTSNNRVIVCGLNYFGELATGDSNPVMTPTDITSAIEMTEGEYIVQLSAGYNHVLYLTNYGTLYSCGGNSMGQLGDGSLTDRLVPYNITPTLTLNSEEVITDFYGGFYTSGFVTSDGRVFVWGKDYIQSIVGPDGIEFVMQNMPLDITAEFTLEPEDYIIEVYTDYLGGVALSMYGEVFTWGDNLHGGIGNYTFEYSSTPVNITEFFELNDGAKILSVRLYYGTLSALSNEWSLYSWGDNNAFQVGNSDDADVNHPLIILATELSATTNLVTDVNYNAGDTIDEYYLPDQPGYSFDGWYLDEILTIPYEFGIMPGNDLDLYGTYQIELYSISYNNLEGADNSSNPTQYTIESETITLSEVSLDGQVFGGWYDNPDFSGEVIAEIPTGSFGNMELYAKWTTEAPTTYTVIFETNGGTAIEPQTLSIDEPLYIADSPTREGYIFEGYWLDADFTVSFEQGTALNQDSTIYVQWFEATAEYDITFNILQESGGLAGILLPGEAIVDVYTNGSTSLAITSHFRILTVGNNTYGTLGDGTTTDSVIPIDITSQFNFAEDEYVQSCDIGTRHIILLSTEGRVFVWGSNMFGELGLGYKNSTNIVEAVDITNRVSLNTDEYITKVAAGDSTSLILTNEGRVIVCGYNNRNVFGYPETSTVYVLNPEDITSHFPTTDLIIDISTQAYHLVILTQMGLVITSGNNAEDCLGTGSTVYYNAPVDITDNLGLSEGEGVIRVEASYIYTTIYTSLNRVLILGDNEYSHLGDTNDLLGIYDFTATLPLGPDEIVLEVSTTVGSLIVLTNENRILVVGENNDAECTMESGNWYSEPIDITAKVNPTGIAVTKMVGGYGNYMVVLSTGEIIGWGYYANGQIFSGASGYTYIPFTTLQITRFIVISTLMYQEGQPVLAYTPELEGHTFDGWYTDQEFNNAYIYGEMPAYSFVLYARFIPIE